jgi:hypothetical protein
MRVDLTSSTRTFSQRSSWLLQMQIVSYQQKLEHMVRVQNSTFGQLLEGNQLNIPDPTVLPSDTRGVSKPSVLVGDEMVALSENIATII